MDCIRQCALVIALPIFLFVVVYVLAWNKGSMFLPPETLLRGETLPPIRMVVEEDMGHYSLEPLHRSDLRAFQSKRTPSYDELVSQTLNDVVTCYWKPEESEYSAQVFFARHRGSTRYTTKDGTRFEVTWNIPEATRENLEALESRGRVTFHDKGKPMTKDDVLRWASDRT